MTFRYRIRRDTAANWTSVNPTLAAGEQGFETDTRRMKIGDGSTAWTSLTYFADLSAVREKADSDWVIRTIKRLDVDSDWILNQITARTGTTSNTIYTGAVAGEHQTATSWSGNGATQVIRIPKNTGTVVGDFFYRRLDGHPTLGVAQIKQAVQVTALNSGVTSSFFDAITIKCYDMILPPRWNSSTMIDAISGTFSQWILERITEMPFAFSGVDPHHDRGVSQPNSVGQVLMFEFQGINSNLDSMNVCGAKFLKMPVYNTMFRKTGTQTIAFSSGSLNPVKVTGWGSPIGGMPIGQQGAWTWNQSSGVFEMQNMIAPQWIAGDPEASINFKGVLDFGTTTFNTSSGRLSVYLIRGGSFDPQNILGGTIARPNQSGFMIAPFDFEVSMAAIEFGPQYDTFSIFVSYFDVSSKIMQPWSYNSTFGLESCTHLHISCPATTSKISHGSV